MPYSRRQLIMGATGTGLALLASAGLWRVTRMPISAIEPWTLDPGPPADVRLDAFRHAILAPNPHNRQPWLIKLAGQDEAIVTSDLAKRLPQTDPFDRQITIGFGTFLELARIAAAERGVRMDIIPFPEGEGQPRLDARPVARLKFIPGPAITADPLFAAIPKRHTNRLSYDEARAVPAAHLAQMVSAPDGFTSDPKVIAPLRIIALNAIKTEQLTHPAHMESVNLMRIGHDEIDATPDGLALSGPKIEALALAGQLDRAQLADPNSTAFKLGLDMQLETYATIPALFWIKTPSNRRVDQLEAGRRYARAHLQATALGLAIHPMSQSLQEYPQVAQDFASIHQRLGATGEERIQMFARVGYADPVTPAPRWPVGKHLIS
jgi:hypothetical protein